MSASGSLIGIDCEDAVRGALGQIKDALESSSATHIVVGLSGGLDSAVTASLCSRVVQTRAMILPDSRITPDSETVDAKEIASLLNIKTDIQDIGPIVDEFAKHVKPDERALGNLRARIRMCVLYSYANSTAALVAGTSDKSETLIGYFTKYGDGAADVYPIRSLYKTQVRKLAKHLEIPDHIIAKKSAPYLLDSGAAEDELGVEYDEIDPILYCIADGGMDDARAADTTGVAIDTVKHVRTLYEGSAHKRASWGDNIS